MSPTRHADRNDSPKNNHDARDRSDSGDCTCPKGLGKYDYEPVLLVGGNFEELFPEWCFG